MLYMYVWVYVLCIVCLHVVHVCMGVCAMYGVLTCCMGVCTMYSVLTCCMGVCAMYSVLTYVVVLYLCNGALQVFSFS